jgi:hypothetical protein
MTTHKKTRRSNPEARIQKQLFEHIHARGVPGLFAFHVPNGGKRNIIEAVNFKRMGVKPGVPDVIAFHDRKTYAMELKAPGRRSTEKQLETRAQLEEAGVYTACCDNLDAAVRVFEAWGLLLGRAA